MKLENYWTIVRISQINLLISLHILEETWQRELVNFVILSLKSLVQSTMCLQPTDETEVINVTDSLKNRKAPGIGEIRADTIKNIPNQWNSWTANSNLTDLINKIFACGGIKHMQIFNM